MSRLDEAAALLAKLRAAAPAKEPEPVPTSEPAP
jgi:hypothetical protein